MLIRQNYEKCHVAFTQQDSDCWVAIPVPGMFTDH